MKALLLGLVLALLGSAAPQLAAASNRQIHKLGVYGTVLGEPVSSFVGINVGYNLGDIARVHGGYGSLATGLVNGSSYGGGVKFFLPGWGFSPYIGAQYSFFSVDSVLCISLPGGISSGTGVLSAGAGIDWQTGFGLYLTVGANMALASSSTSAIPFFGLGWFF